MTAEHTHDHDHDHGHTHAERRDPEELSRAPRFDSGTSVVLRDAAPERYKRRPEYAEGAEGTIEHLHGAYVPPGSQDESDPEYEFLYSVRFTHTEIWGDDHPEPNGSIYIDIWETALKRAETP